MRAFTKDILREVKNSFGRFFSIMMIVAIGTAFFSGVRASVPDMKNSADTYFDDQNLMDIRMLSSMGFSEEDVKAISKVDGIEGMDATYSMDFLAERGTRQIVVKTIAWQDLKADDKDYINQVVLVEGRLPKKENECLIESSKMMESGFQIGDTITLKSGDDKDIDDFLKQTTFTIVGSCQTPDYLSFEKGSSTIGSGKVDTFIMVPKSNYISEYYTEILLRVKGAKEENTYEEAYFDVVDPIVNELENVGMERSDIRFEEIKQIAQEKWEEGKAEFEEGKATFEKEIASAEAQLDAAKTQLILGEAALQSGKTNLETTQIALEAQIAQAEASLTMYESMLEEAEVMQETMHEQYDSLLVQYEQTIQETNAKIAQLEEDLKQATTDEEKANIQMQIDVEKAMLERYESAMESAQKAIATIDEKVAYYEGMIVEGKAQIETSKAQLANGEEAAQAQFAQAEAELEAGWDAYTNGMLELETNKAIGEEELEIAEENLEAAKLQLEDLPQPSWYVLDRNSHYSYRDYESVTERMDGIAKVFPLFFLIVAALVCLTTMTRMVDEQRQTIGTYKALGYSKEKIAVKYLAYALIAGIVGSILGCTIGMYLFPSVIFSAWNLMYNLPGLVFTPQISLALISSVSVIAVTLLAAGFACYKELVEVPSALMRPKAPKKGKTILLERVPFLWKRFSFTMKVTARNIFRYKKRFFMTVIGISGCTALLLAGFGIRDSIEQIVNIQYKEITQYDAMINLDANAPLKERRTVIQDIEEYEESKDLLALTTLHVSMNVDGEDTAITLMIPDNSKELGKFISLRTRNGHEPLSLSGGGAIISEKLARNLGVKENDTISITFDDGIVRDVEISGICENYIGHMMYMTPTYYKTLTGQRISENTVLLKMNKANAESENKLGNAFVKNDAVSSITFYRGVADTFDETIQSISFVTYVLIGAAGLLAFVVLYNLTNVNISERLREIATIKVLGFYDMEVASYVYRENIFLTFIGSLVGLGLGIALHALIMNLAEMPDVMFGRNISLMSFVLALVITSLFGMIVNLVMYKKLKSIPMVESLKSVE